MIGILPNSYIPVNTYIETFSNTARGLGVPDSVTYFPRKTVELAFVILDTPASSPKIANPLYE
jgi:hypothetical protein